MKKKKKNERAGADGGFCDRGGQEMWYTVTVWAR